MPTRRDLTRSGALLAAVMGGAGPAAAAGAGAADEAAYGLVTQFKAHPGQRDRLAAILAGGASSMPGCRAYIVAADAGDPDALWITEAWDSKASHDASLDLPAVKAKIAEGRPLIAGFGARAELAHVTGVGGR